MCPGLKSTGSAQPSSLAIYLEKKMGTLNFELGTAICYVNVDNYYKAYRCFEHKVIAPLIGV